jgi:hypothetical protein
MDFNKLIERVKAILLTPKATWPVIAQEPTTTADLYKGYVLILAAVPAVFGFLDAVLFGYDIPFAGNVRMGFGFALSTALLTYGLSIFAVFLMALIVDMLAPNFGGQKSSVQALKAVAYAFTASWVAGVGAIVPYLSLLIALAGAVYSIYLLYLGLPPNMKVPQERAAVYTAVVVVVAIVLSWVVNFTVGTIMFSRGGFPSSVESRDSSDIRVDPDSSLGKLQKWGEEMEKAGQKFEAAQKSGDGKAQGEALGAVMGAVLGGGADRVESLPPERMKAMLPESLAGMTRKSISAERNSALGLQVSKSEAQYVGDDSLPLSVEITDTGGAGGLMLLAGWANLEQDRETDTGYEKTYRQNGRMVHEEWDHSAQSGTYTLVLGERFIAEIRGRAASMDQLKTALTSLDLSALEALKNEGRKPE